MDTASNPGVTRAVGKRQTSSSSPGASRTTPRQRKRANTTFQSTRVKRQRLPERPMDDVGSGSEDDGEVFDETQLTRADIPTIVEAVMSQFLKESANGSEQEDEGSDDDNWHLNVPSVAVAQLNEVTSFWQSFLVATLQKKAPSPSAVNVCMESGRSLPVQMLGPHHHFSP